MTDRELDAKVAERVMGWSAVEYDAGDSRTMGVCHGTPPGPKSDHLADLSLHGTGTGSYHIPRYSSTGDGMLLVVEAMRGRGYRVEVDVLPPEANTVEYAVRVKVTKFSSLMAVVDHAPTAPRAVALAALRALGVEVS